MARPIVALFAKRADAQAAISDLRSAGFPERAIGTVGLEDAGSSPKRRATDVKPAAQNAAAAAQTALLSGATADSSVLPNAALIIQDVGRLVTGGTLASLVGGAAGWLADGLKAIGVPDADAVHYEESVRQGRTLVTIFPHGRQILATDILSRNQGNVSDLSATGFKDILKRAHGSERGRDIRSMPFERRTVPPATRSG